MTPDDITRITWVSDPQISPDGARVAFVATGVSVAVPSGPFANLFPGDSQDECVVLRPVEPVDQSSRKTGLRSSRR